MVVLRCALRGFRSAFVCARFARRLCVCVRAVGCAVCAAVRGGDLRGEVRSNPDFRGWWGMLPSALRRGGVCGYWGLCVCVRRDGGFSQDFRKVVKRKKGGKRRKLGRRELNGCPWVWESVSRSALGGLFGF